MISSVIFKRFARRAVLLIQLGMVLAAGLPQGKADSVQKGEGHRFLCADYTQGKVFVVSREGRVEWEYPAPDCNDLWALTNGNYLFTTGHGVVEIKPDKTVVFSYESRSEVYACQRLADGNTFVG